MTDKSKIDEAFERWRKKYRYLERVTWGYNQKTVHYTVNATERAFTAGYKQCGIDAGKKADEVIESVHFLMANEKISREQAVIKLVHKQSRIDLAEDIHVALTFAECGLKDKDYALKLAREIIDKELDEDYWSKFK